MSNYSFLPLRGPNRWSPNPILEVHCNQPLSQEPDSTSVAIGLALKHFLEAKHFTTTHPQSVANATRIVEQLTASVNEAELWLACSRWFSALAGVPTRELAKTIESRISDGRNITVMALEMEEQALTERCVDVARDWLDSASSLDSFPLTSKVRELFDYADDVRLGPSSRAILRAAKRRSIPYTRLNSGSLVQLGEGKKQRRIWTAETDATSAIAEAIASDKDLTKRLLRQVGVPVPHGRAVASAEDAWTAAQEIGFPVVVKPCNANHQRGISIELNTREEILTAYDFAVREGETTDILVEQYAHGTHHRLLVVGNQMVAAAKGRLECVIGDGISTVEELVERENQDPRRGEAYTDPLGVIILSEPAIIELAKQGLTIKSVPERDRNVLVRRTGDLVTDCTELVHPETAEQAVLAARVVGLDIAGLDILATDISKPLTDQRGAFVEVNAGPSLSPHVSPLYGKPQKVGDAIMNMLFPAGSQGHIHIIGVIKSPSSDALMQQLAEQLRLRNVDFGMLKDGQAGFNGRIVDTGCVHDDDRVIALLCNPILSALVVQIDVHQSAIRGVCTPRLDRVLFATDALPVELDSEIEAGLRAILNAVPDDGTLFGDRLHPAVFAKIQSWKHSKATVKNSLEKAFAFVV